MKLAAARLPFGSVWRVVRHGRFLDVLTANHAIDDDLPPAPDDLVLGGVDERVQTAIAVGEHREQQVEVADSRSHVEAAEDRVGTHADEAKSKADRYEDHRLDDIHLLSLIHI